MQQILQQFIVWKPRKLLCVNRFVSQQCEDYIEEPFLS